MNRLKAVPCCVGGVLEMQDAGATAWHLALHAFMAPVRPCHTHQACPVEMGQMHLAFTMHILSDLAHRTPGNPQKPLPSPAQHRDSRLCRTFLVVALCSHCAGRSVASREGHIYG